MKNNKQFNPFEIYEVSNEYINYLKKYDDKIKMAENDSYQNKRKYLSIILNNGEQYLIPFSSPKDSDYLNGVPRKSFVSLIRIINKDLSENMKVIGKLKLSSMIPIKNLSEIEIYDISEEKDEKYRHLLEKQIAFINENKDMIQKSAETLYSKKNKNYNMSFVKSTVNFRNLEWAANNFKNL